MVEVIWVERLSRHGEVVARERFSALPLTVGRGYAADLIVDDPAVAPRHLRVFRDDAGVLIAEDLGSLNGLHADGARVERIEIHGNRILRLGDTRLRVRTADHAVAGERASEPPRRAWPLALGLAAALCGIITLHGWLGESGEPSVSAYVYRMLLPLLLSGIWAGIWAVLTRVFSGYMAYAWHLALALAALLLLVLSEDATTVTAYSLSASRLVEYQPLLAWGIVGALCYAHLRLMGPGRPQLKLGVVMALAALGIGWSLLQQQDLRERRGPTSVLRQLQPPPLRLTAPVSAEEFFAASAGLQGDLERARTEKPQQQSGPDFD